MDSTFLMSLQCASVSLGKRATDELENSTIVYQQIAKGPHSRCCGIQTVIVSDVSLIHFASVPQAWRDITSDHRMACHKLEQVAARLQVEALPFCSQLVTTLPQALTAHAFGAWQHRVTVSGTWSTPPPPSPPPRAAQGARGFCDLLNSSVQP